MTDILAELIILYVSVADREDEGVVKVEFEELGADKEILEEEACSLLEETVETADMEASAEVLAPSTVEERIPLLNDAVTATSGIADDCEV